MIIIKKAIEIAGWLSDREIGKGQTALWTGSGIEETCEISDGYYFEDDEIEYELAEAQKYADAMIAHNNWPITVTARINEYEFDTADFE